MSSLYDDLTSFKRFHTNVVSVILLTLSLTLQGDFCVCVGLD